MVGLFRDYRENIADKTARRYCSREIFVDNSTEARRSCETFPGLQSTATGRKYPPFFFSFFLCARFPLRSNRVCRDKFSAETVGSTRFSLDRFLFVDDRRHDRQGERTGSCQSAIVSSSRRRRSSTPSTNGRDERERIIEHRWATTVSGVTILLSLTVFLNLVAETLPQVSDAIPLLGTIEFLHRANVRVLNQRVLSVHYEWNQFWRRNRESLAGSSGRLCTWIFERNGYLLCIYIFHERFPSA